MKRELMLAATVVGWLTATLSAHEGEHEHASTHVTITVDGPWRLITSDGVPEHKTGEFPNRGNPNAIRPQAYQFRVPVEPKVSDVVTPLHHQPFGVAVNGVVFDPGTAEWWRGNAALGWNYEALSGKINLGLDDNHAHVQPSGAYHYHGLPSGLVEQLGGVKDHMLLVGYAADGFPIYAAQAHAKSDDATSELKTMRSSYRLRTGERLGGELGPGGAFDGTFTVDYEYVAGAGDLDECNGRTGVTPEYPQGTYYYVLTEEFPHVPRQYRGTPDTSFARQPRAVPRGPRRGPPPPPRPR